MVFLIHSGSFSVPLLLLYHFTLFSMILLNQLFLKKPIRLTALMVIIINGIGIVTNYLVLYYSTDTNYLLTLFTQERSMYDLNYIQSFSSLLIYDCFTKMYYLYSVVVLFFLLYKLIMKKKTTLKKDKNKKYNKRFFIILLSIFCVLNVSVLIYFYIDIHTLYERDIQPISGCYSSHMNLGLGKEYLNNNYYFDRCFETSEGIYTVYKEVEKEERNFFDLIQEVKFKRIILFNENGTEILSLDLYNRDVNIYVTTFDELNQGYSNLISVEQNDTTDEKMFPYYTFYNLSGELILELPYGLPDRAYSKTDLLDKNGLKVLFKDNKLVYKPIEDGKIIGTYYFYLDGTKELIVE